MDETVRAVITAYGLDPDAVRISRMGSGHIHKTYLVERIGGGPPMVLQRINHAVFNPVERLMYNMEQVTSHIAFLNRKEGKDPAGNGVLLLEAEGGKSWTGNEETGYWRMSWYIEDQVSYEVAENERIAREGGKVIARFQSMLMGLGMDGIADTIPGFHDLFMRLEQYEESLNNASSERLDEAGQMTGLTSAYVPAMVDLYTASAAMKLPVRLTHNDTKFNNILFGKDGVATCLIDLDTVMKGYAWFDFGDALRTCASTAPEDEPDPAKIGFRMDIFRAFSEGFLAEAKCYLTAEEVSVLHRAPAAFAFMQGLRFLTDFLNGDVYYRIRSANHNLVRAVAQYTLMQRILEKEDEMAENIRDAAVGVGIS